MAKSQRNYKLFRKLTIFLILTIKTPKTLNIMLIF